MKKINVGVIGGGFIGPVHVESLRRLGNVDVVAIATSREEGAKKLAEQLCIPKAYGDYQALIQDEQVQAVHICTPNYLHYPMAKAAILAGKHVVCDKPLAMTAAQGEELRQLASRQGVVAAVSFNLRFYPLIHQIKAMVQAGELGEIYAINGSYQQDWLQLPQDYSWRLEPEQAGEARAIGDIGSHWLDGVEFMTGLKIEEVCADFATFLPVRKKPKKAMQTFSGKLLKNEDYEDVQITTEDYASVLLHFAGGAHGTLTVNQAAAGRKNRLFYEIYGSKAGVCFNGEKPNQLWIGKRTGNNELIIKDPALVLPPSREIISYPGGHAEGFGDTFKQCFKRIYAYLLGGQQGEILFPTFADGVRELKISEAIVTSAKKRAWETVQ